MSRRNPDIVDDAVKLFVTITSLEEKYTELTETLRRQFALMTPEQNREYTKRIVVIIEERKKKAEAKRNEKPPMQGISVQSIDTEEGFGKV